MSNFQGFDNTSRAMQSMERNNQALNSRADAIAAQAREMESRANSMQMRGGPSEKMAAMTLLGQSQQMKSLAERMRAEGVSQPESAAEQKQRQHQAVEGYVSTKQGAESLSRDRKMAETPSENRSEKALVQAVMLEKQASLYRSAGNPPATLMANQLQDQSRQLRAAAERMRFEDSLAGASSDDVMVIDPRSEKARSSGGNVDKAAAKAALNQSQPSDGKSTEARSRELMAQADALEMKAKMRRATGGPIGNFESLQMQEQSRQLRLAVESMRRSS